MNNIKNYFLIFSVFVFLSIGIDAQEKKAKRSRDIVQMKVLRVWSEGKRHLFIKVKAEIKKGWKLYAANMKKGGPIPTTFSFPYKDAKVIKILEWPKPESERDPNFEMIVKHYTYCAWFTIKTKIKEIKKIYMLRIRFMVCHDKTGICLPPDKVLLPIKNK